MHILRLAGVAGIGARMSFMGIERRDIDRDRLHKPIIRDPNIGSDRVRMIFDRSEDGSISPELCSINFAGFFGMFIGGIIGGVLQLRMANLNFRECNEATLFQSNMDARRKLQNESTVGFGKGAFRFGWRIGLFCWTFIGITTIASEYRNKSSISDYSLAGLVTGALFKTNLGIRGMISGGFFGTLIGTVGGVAIISALTVSGRSMKEIRQSHSKYIYARDEAFHASNRTQLAEPDIILDNFRSRPSPKDFSGDIFEDLADIDQPQSKTELTKNANLTANIQRIIK